MWKKTTTKILSDFSRCFSWRINDQILLKFFLLLNRNNNQSFLKKFPVSGYITDIGSKDTIVGRFSVFGQVPLNKVDREF